jgi:hypothetical protein
LNLFVAITGLPPGKFSLTSPGTKIPGQVTALYTLRESRRRTIPLTGI